MSENEFKNMKLRLSQDHLEIVEKLEEKLKIAVEALEEIIETPSGYHNPIGYMVLKASSALNKIQELDNE